MTKVVILAEKPSQAKAYAEAFTILEKTKTYIQLKPDNTFPDGATITWGVGHLVELKEPHDYKPEWKRWKLDQLPIVPERFYEKVSKGKWEQFQAVKRLFKQADVLVNAADVDREGSNIFYSILRLTGVKGKPVRRLWINSLERDEVRNGFKNLQTNEKDLRLFDEAKARQISDWMVGINASRLFKDRKSVV